MILPVLTHICIYPVLCPKLTLIQPTWSVYPYHLVFLICYPYSLVFLIWYPYALTSLYGNTAHCSGNGVAIGCYGLFIVTRTAIVTSQWWPLLFHGIRADLSETPNNALTTRMHGDYRPSIDRFFVGFNAICYAFLRNNPIYIEGRNCSFSTVPVLFNKCSGLRPSDTLSSWRLGWRRHARVGKPFFGKSLDLEFQSFTIIVLTIYLYWIKGILRGYAIRTGRRPSGSQRPGLRSALRPLTSLGTSAWPYRVTTQYSYCIWLGDYIHMHLCVNMLPILIHVCI